MRAAIRILLTGATGFLGKRVAARLIGRGHTVSTAGRRPYSRDIAHFPMDMELPGSLGEVTSALRGGKFDCLAHLGWYSKPPDFWTAEANLACLTASTTLFQGAADSGTHVVSVGSCAEYDLSGASSKLAEESDRLFPASLYGIAKASLWHVMAEASRLRGSTIPAWLRIFFLYGPGEPKQKIVSSIIAACIKQEIPKLNSPDRKVDFIFVEDVAEVIVRAIEGRWSGPVNLGTGTGTSSRELALYAARQLAPKLIGTIEELPAVPSSADVIADVARLMGLLDGWTLTPITQGMDETIETLLT